MLLDPPLQVDHVGHELPILHVAGEAVVYRRFTADLSLTPKSLPKNSLLVLVLSHCQFCVGVGKVIYALLGVVFVIFQVGQEVVLNEFVVSVVWDLVVYPWLCLGGGEVVDFIRIR